MVYKLSLKVERKYIIAPLFTDDAPLFTDDELPTFTEGSKKISITNVH